MAQTRLLPCFEARIEEKEFYHLVYNQKGELNEKEESLDEFFGDMKNDKIKPKDYPPIWRNDFYDPFESSDVRREDVQNS